MPSLSHSPAIVLLSGGLDSAVTLACARADGHRCYALTFEYGQRHRHELDAAERVADAQGVPAGDRLRLVIDLRVIGGSALTSDRIDVPKDRTLPERSTGVPPTYVPARNLIFLSLAAAFAETVRARDLYAGMNAIDYSGYPDCREPFLRAFAHAATLGTKAGAEDGLAFRVHAPLLHMSKHQIIRRGLELGVNFALTHSCYDPVERGGEALACGRCDSCLIRAKGFKDAGAGDPTRYA